MWIPKIAVLMVILIVSSFCRENYDSSSEAIELPIKALRRYYTAGPSATVSRSFANPYLYRRNSTSSTQRERNTTIAVYCNQCLVTETFNFTFSPNNTIGYIKERLRVKLGLGYELQYCFRFNSQELDDKETIRELGTGEGNVLEIFITAKGDQGLGGMSDGCSVDPVPNKTVTWTSGCSTVPRTFEKLVLANTTAKDLVKATTQELQKSSVTGLPSPPSIPIKIHLKITSEYTGEVFEGLFFTNDTVLTIKQRFGIKSGTEGMHLVYQNTELWDGYSLAQAGVEDGACIVLVDDAAALPGSLATPITPNSTTTTIALNTVHKKLTVSLATNYPNTTAARISTSTTTATVLNTTSLANGNLTVDLSISYPNTSHPKESKPNPILPEATYTQASSKDIMITFSGATFIWTGAFSPSDTILSIKQALGDGTGMMWRYLTLVYNGDTLIDDQATLDKIGFVIGDNMNLSVIFATKTVTKTVIVMATKQHNTIGPSSSEPISTPELVILTDLNMLSTFTTSTLGPVHTAGDFQSSMRLPITLAA